MSVLDYIDSDIFTPVYQNKLPVIATPTVDNICREIFYAIHANEPIAIYGDYDMDGFCAVKVWDEVLSSLYDIPPIHFQYSCRQHTLDSDIISQFEKTDARIVIICDTGSGLPDHHVVSLLRMCKKLPIVIDHHNWVGDYEEAKKYGLVFNSYMEKDLLNGFEVSGAYASLLVADRLCTKFFNHSLSYNAMVYALASMYSDVVDLSTPPGRALYNMVSTIKMPMPALLSAMNTWGYSICRRFFSFIIGPKVNACFRMESFGPLNQAFLVRDKYQMSTVADSFASVHSEASKLTELFTPMFEREHFGDIHLCVHEASIETRGMHIRNFSGLVANKVAREEKGAVIAVIKDNNKYAGSFRDYYNRNMLNTFKLFSTADGHESAFGVEFSNIKDFRRHLQQLSTTISHEARKDYEVISSKLVSSEADVQILAMYNEYMNVKPRVLLMHRCPYARVVKSTRYKKFYDIGLPYTVSSTVPILEGSLIQLEPAITKSVELRCVD